MGPNLTPPGELVRFPAIGHEGVNRVPFRARGGGLWLKFQGSAMLPRGGLAGAAAFSPAVGRHATNRAKWE
jgi:hypothetical protein